MIIWSRWGFLGVLGLGIGVGLGFGLSSALGLDNGPLTGALIFACGSAVNLALALLVFPRLDRPYQVTYTRPLPQPYRHPNGAVQTAETLPALDAEGRSIWARPRSTLFFIPATVIWIILLVVALVLLVAGVVSLF